MTDRYINLFTDYGFKKIFGEEPNKDLLMGFLNELLDGEEYIQDLTYLNNERLGKREGERKAVFDLYCTNDKGEKFIVEVQRVKQQFFKERSIYYSTFAVQEQASKGKQWQYELKSVYTIAILDFKFDDINPNFFHHHVQLMETKRHEVFYDKFTFIYLEIPKFLKPLDALETDYERWLFAFKNLHKLAEQPKELEAGVFKRLLEVAEISKMNKKEQEVYQESLKDYRDLKGAMDTYYLDGRKDEKIETAKQAIQEGLSNDLIMRLTGLSKEEIDALRS